MNEPVSALTDSPHPVYSTSQLIDFRNSFGTIIDCRPSRDYCHENLTGSRWGNISELIVTDERSIGSIVVIGNNITHAAETADLLLQHEWSIAGIYSWNTNDISRDQIGSDAIQSPADQSELFAGRHHGNMQDSRDYLDWEEALPEQIDQSIHNLWLENLENTQPEVT